MSSSVTTWLKFGLQQMAAEAYLDQINLSDLARVKQRLLEGNNDARFAVPDANGNLPGMTRFTNTLADRFLGTFQIIDHHANDATGFSATLTRDMVTGEYTLSFRSTEAKHQAAGGDWERDGLPGADGEIAGTGFALAQLVSMEKYYRAIKADPTKLPPGVVLNVTGYSLGGHLATVFTELHASEINATYTFNGAGRGRINGGTAGLRESERIREMLQLAEMQLDAIDPTWFASGNTGNVYTDQRYRDVRQATILSFDTTNSFLPGEIRTGGGFDKITQLVGLATHNDQPYVANSGIHAPPTTIFIEDQPNVDGLGGLFGQSGSFGTTHSITLIVDSLAVEERIQEFAPSLGRDALERLLAASSSLTGSGFVGVSGLAEGNSLENILDSLRKVFDPNATPTPFGRLTNDFGQLTFRNPFYESLDELRGRNAQLISLVDLSSSEVFAKANSASPEAIAYRYALRELNPFVIIGIDYEALHNQDHSLDIYDANTGIGIWTQMALSDRAELLAEKLRFNQSDGTPSSPTLFVDETTNFNNQRGASAAETVIFGDTDGREYLGRRGNDHIYGGAGNDFVHGATGQDYLEGNDGNDELFGEADNDILVGQQGNDRLDGGTGVDRMIGGVGDDIYIVDSSGDNVVEFENGGRDQVLASANFSLGTHVENLILTGTGNTSGTGNNLDNRIIGNSGNNRLSGMGGNDLLEGGIGFDTYIYNAGDGLDRIEDSDAQGKIIFDDRVLQGGVRRAGDATNTYTSLDGKTIYVMSGTDLIVNGVLIVNENFQSGQMGIQLRDVSEMPDDMGVPAGPFHNIYVGTDGDNPYIGRGFGPMAIYGNGGNDSFGGDNFPGETGFQDLLDGGLGNDVFFGGYGDDYMIGGSGDDYAVMTEGDMFLGGDGDDYAVGIADFWDFTGPRIGNGEHYADGESGNDTLMGEMGADVLLGGDGNDVLRGENRPSGWASLYYDNFIWYRSPQPAMTSLSGGDDYLDGGAGNDLLVGDGGDDILLGGAGDDRLYGESDFTQTIAGDDWLEGGEGNDSLFGGAGADRLSGGDGDDLLVGDFSDDPGSADVLDGGAGADELQGGGGDDILYGGTGMDLLAGFGGNDFLDGGTNNDELQGGLGDDALWGGGSNDRIFGQEGDDTLFGDEGDDELQGDVGNDTLFGGEGQDALFGQDGNDLLSGEAGDDVLNGGAGNDQLDGGDGIDDVQGREGNDSLVGGVGNDFLYGDGNNPTVPSLEGGNDTLDGQEGDDQLWGGAGRDQLFGGEGGDQLVGDAGDDQLYGGTGDDLLVGDSPFFLNQAGADLLDGGEGNDVLQGGAGDDDLQGRSGDDYLIGGDGVDTYRFNLGDGADTIQDTAVQSNRLVFGEGITAESVRLDVAPNDSLVLRVGNGGDMVQITGFGLNAPEFHSIRQFEFADGTVLTDAELLARGFQLSSPAAGGSLQGTSFADHIQGSQVADWLYGRDGNDVLLGGQGDDALEGGEGDDELDGGDGNDRLYGNEGFNVLRGGEGNDVLDSAGLGDQLFGGTGDDAYHLRATGQIITEAMDAGRDTVYLTPTESLTFQAPNNVENVSIEDDVFLSPTTQVNLVGNALDNELSGSHRLDGQAGNDTLIGTGDNTFVFGPGYGQDVVRMGMQVYAHSGLDQVQFLAGVAPSDLSLERQANDLVVKVSGTADELRVQSYYQSPANMVDQFLFADGTIWTSGEFESRVRTFIGVGADESFYGSEGDDTIRGMAGNDQIRASAGNDVLDGGAGNDFLEGYVGNDVYVFGRGYGQDAIDEQGDGADIDTLQLVDGITAGDIILQATPDFQTDAVLTIKNTADHVTLAGFFQSDWNRVDRIQFSDGTVWDYSAMLAHTEGVNLVGTEETDYQYGNVTNDTLFGLGGDDILAGGAGNDTLDGGMGVDRMTGGTGNDLYVVDTINDVVTEQAGQGTDTVQSSVTYVLGSNLENLTLIGNGAINGTGNSLNNILIGNAAANVLTGGAGNDTYVVGVGDTVVESAGAGTDTVKSDISWTLETNLENLVLTGITAVNGTGNSLANTLTGNSAANILSGAAGADTLIGAQGDDLYIVDNVGDKVTESVGEGIDTIQSSVTYTLSANVENLTLSGTSAVNGTGNGLDNLMIGNSAANKLTGGAGNDTYVVGAGDTVIEAINAGIDTVQSSVTHTLAGNVENLTLLGTGTINGTGNTLNNILIGNNAANTLTGGAGDDTYVVGAGDTVVEALNAGIDTVQSSVTWTLGANVENLTLTGTAAINGTGNTLANVLTGNAGNNALAGGDGNDTLSGGKGNDALNGGTGNDVFQFARGDGQDTITDASGTGDRLSFASGIDPLDLMLSQSANDLRIAVYGSTDQVTIANWYAGASNQVETVQVGNGQQLMSTQVNQLIQAMAGFTQQTGLSWDQAIAQRPQDVQQILAANWH
ncbi:MAG: hypothetical protein JSR64_06570 [Nitrospira sp.]|nr:hypothetical protein [Nitrospira sp.]MBS0173682.1 hypothetical protein [Nitrospira sp.]